MHCKLIYKESSLRVKADKLYSIDIFNQKSSEQILYILFRFKDKSLKLSIEDLLSKYQAKDYQVIASKKCSKREFELLKSTLYEINLIRANSNKTNNLESIYYYLDILGCKLKDEKKSMKKKYQIK